MFARPASTVLLLLFCLTELLGTPVASSPAPASPLPLIAIIALLVSALRRKQAIGGWLLFFLFLALLGGTLSLFFEAVAYRSYLPGAWNNSREYLWFLLMTLPVHIAKVLLIAGCIMLVRTGEWIWVERLKWILVASLLCWSLGYAIQRQVFPHLTWLSVFSPLPPAVFLAYLLRSTRVRRVFRTKDWDRPSGSPS